MNIYVVAVMIFCIAVIFIELISYGLATLKDPDRADIRKKLRKMAYRAQIQKETTDITKKMSYSDIGFLHRMLQKTTIGNKLHQLLYQANAGFSVGFYLMLMILLAIIGFYYFSFQRYPHPIPLLGCLVGTTPIIYLKLKKQRRMEKFLRQLPEALDMIASSLRAGHAFSTGMRLVADEFDDPLGMEFDITLDEINFGIAVPDALHKMTERVSCKDLNFFVVAVILQRETGGNLAQILENISFLIRERFKLFGKIKALAAEGTISMYVLLCMPVAMGFILSYVNSDYMDVLFQDPFGRIMIGFAVVLMILGAFVMKNMIRIKV